MCPECTALSKKTRGGKPHGDLSKIDDLRLFRGTGARSFEEQDYRCQRCGARFTHSTAKNDLAWTLWRG